MGDTSYEDDALSIESDYWRLKDEITELQATNLKLVEALKEIVSARKMVEDSHTIENKMQRGVVFSNSKVRLEAAIKSASALIGEVEGE